MVSPVKRPADQDTVVQPAPSRLVPRTDSSPDPYNPDLMYPVISGATAIVDSLEIEARNFIDGIRTKTNQAKLEFKEKAESLFKTYLNPTRRLDETRAASTGSIKEMIANGSAIVDGMVGRARNECRAILLVKGKRLISTIIRDVAEKRMNEVDRRYFQQLLIAERTNMTRLTALKNGHAVVLVSLRNSVPDMLEQVQQEAGAAVQRAKKDLQEEQQRQRQAKAKAELEAIERRRVEREAADRLRAEREAADRLRAEREAADRLRAEREAADRLRTELEAADRLHHAEREAADQRRSVAETLTEVTAPATAARDGARPSDTDVKQPITLPEPRGPTWVVDCTQTESWDAVEVGIIRPSLDRPAKVTRGMRKRRKAERYAEYNALRAAAGSNPAPQPAPPPLSFTEAEWKVRT
jgi:hypothetical protein